MASWKEALGKPRAEVSIFQGEHTLPLHAPSYDGYENVKKLMGGKIDLEAFDSMDENQIILVTITALQAVCPDCESNDEALEILQASNDQEVVQLTGAALLICAGVHNPLEVLAQREKAQPAPEEDLDPT